MAVGTAARPLLLVFLLGSLVAACMGGAEAEPLDGATETPAATSLPQQLTATSAPTSEMPGNETPAPPSPTPLPPAPAPLATTTAPPEATQAAVPTATLLTPVPTPAPSPSPPADGPVIVLDPAHNPTAPGALGTEYREVLTTALYTKAALEEAGYTVYLTRYNNDTINEDNPEFRPPNADEFHPGYSRAYAQASAGLQYDPDLVIVLHYNGIGDPSVGGIEVYYCEMGSDQNIVLAEIVLEELVNAFHSIGYEPPRARVIEDLAVARGNRHFPSLGNVYDFPTTWIENRYSHIPVVLTEPLYLTNPTEAALMEDTGIHLAFADAYVRAVNRYFGR
jgi:N-acetylmuramoyl-L-alanine amidase